MNKPKSPNAQRLAKYYQRMKEFGFRRISFYGSAELNDFLRQQREQGECTGRTLERLLLGEAAQRPDYWTRQERSQRAHNR